LIPGGLFFIPQGDFEPLFDSSHLVEPFELFLLSIGFDSADGILNLDCPDFIEVKDPEDTVWGICPEVISES